MNRHDTAVAIEEWQKRQQQEASRPEDRSITARLCDGILNVLHHIISELSSSQRSGIDTPNTEAITKKTCMSLARTRATIALWSDGYGIQDGRLDEVLAKSRNLRRSTLKTLSSIANTLLDRLIPTAGISSDGLRTLTVPLAATCTEARYTAQGGVDGEHDSDASSDGFSDAGSDDNMAEMIEDLKTDAECLMDLDPLFRDPVLDLPWHKENQQLQEMEWTPEKNYSSKVQQRFPEAQNSLVEMLGKANWERFLRCQKLRNSAEMASQQLANTTDKGGGGTVAGSSRYHDSGLGTSLPTASLYAETIMTYASGDGQKTRIPPLPDEAKGGKRFPCLACGRSVRITNNSAWKKHLYQDLQPYVCLETHCAQLTFSDRIDWVHHLALDHSYQPAWASVSCPLCLKATGAGQMAVTTHLARHLEEISLAALPIYLEEDITGFDTDSESGNGSMSKTAEDENSVPNTSGKERVESGSTMSGSIHDAPASQPGWSAGGWDLNRAVLEEEDRKAHVEDEDRLQLLAERQDDDAKNMDEWLGEIKSNIPESDWDEDEERMQILREQDQQDDSHEPPDEVLREMQRDSFEGSEGPPDLADLDTYEELLREGGELPDLANIEAYEEIEREQIIAEEEGRRAYELMMYEENELHRELAVDEHLNRLEAEEDPPFISSDEEDEGDEEDDQSDASESLPRDRLPRERWG